MKIVIFGLSITSSWGNGHATTYRALVRELTQRGHSVLFLERNQPWYESHRDFTGAPYCRVELYESLFEAQEAYGPLVADADAVIVGSYVPDGRALGEWVVSVAGGVTAFYDIDTPVTVEALEADTCFYLTRDLAAEFDVYLSFSGGPILDRIRTEFRAARVAPLYCSVDPEIYFPGELPVSWEIGYLGTYSADRQPKLEELLLSPARTLPESRFVVAGSQYPPTVAWPPNVGHISHLEPAGHRAFYARQRFSLNVTRSAMVSDGYSPSVRLFEAAACGTPVISDRWRGIEQFFEPGEEILLADSAAEVLQFLKLPHEQAREIGRRAHDRVMREHTAAHRAAELEAILESISMPIAKGTEVVR